MKRPVYTTEEERLEARRKSWREAAARRRAEARQYRKMMEERVNNPKAVGA
jgi:hypothetical protein